MVQQPKIKAEGNDTVATGKPRVCLPPEEVSGAENAVTTLQGVQRSTAGETLSARHSGHTEEELRHFIDEWTPRSVCENWDPTFVYVSGKRTVEIHWCDIDNPRRLHRLSEFAEKCWLAQIEAARNEWIAKRAQAGVPAYIASVQFERMLCQQDLYYLAKHVLGYDRMQYHLHKYMCESVSDLPKGYRGLREFPRDAYKTTCMTISFMVQRVLRNPDVRILLKSNAEGNASKKLVEAKTHFVPSPAGTRPDRIKKLPALFPEHAPRNKNDEGSGCYWRTPATQAVQQDGTFCAAGVGSSKVSQHFDIVVGDDFWDEKSVQNPDVMARIRKEMRGLDYLLVSPAEGIIFFVGTRFAHDDPTESLRRQKRFHCIIVSGLLKNGRSLFPESLTVETYFDLANGDDDDGESSGIYVFSCQVMLNPTSTDRGFKEEWFRYRRWTDIKKRVENGEMAIRKVVLTDAAADSAKTSDNVAIGVVVITSENDYCVIDGIRAKLAPSDFLKTIEGYWDRYDPELVVRQKTGLETAIMSFAQEENDRRRKQGRRSIVWHDYSLKRRDKKSRITGSLQPRMQRGQIHFDPDLPALDEIKREFLQFPNAANDDYLDMLSELDDPVVCYVPKFRSAPTPPPSAFIPTQQTACAAEQAFRRNQVQELYAHMSGTAKRVRERPGMRTE